MHYIGIILALWTNTFRKTLAFIYTSMDPSSSPSSKIFARQFKDSSPPCNSHAELFRQGRDFITSLGLVEVLSTSLSFAFARPIYWCLLGDGIVLVELFASIGTGLAKFLEVVLKVRLYIHVDTQFVSNKAA